MEYRTLGRTGLDYAEANLSAIKSKIGPEVVREIVRILEPVRNVYWESGRAQNHNPGALKTNRSEEKG